MDNTTEKRPRTVILGIDGISYYLLRHYIEAGRLPALAGLARRGAFTRVESTMPFHSAAAWTTITTGVNPGRHGLIDFVQHEPRRMAGRLIDAADVTVPRFYDFAGAKGRTCCISNVPVTYPPRPVPGTLTTGLLTPAEEEVFTHPPELSAELRNLFGPPHFAPGQAFAVARKQEYLDTLLRGVEYRGQVTMHLLKTRPADVYLLVFMEGDHAVHKLWGPFEPGAPSCGLEDGPFDPGLLTVLEAIDEWIGRILAELHEDDTVMVLSDHGCARLVGTVNVNRWLVAQGLLVPKRSLRGALKRFAARLDLVVRGYRLLARLGLGKIIYLFPRTFRSRAVGSFQSLAKDVDWARTRAYAVGAHGKVYVNLKGREPHGCVEPGAEYDALCRDIAGRLNDLHDEDGRPLVNRVQLGRGKTYRGPHAENLPDVVFSMADRGMLMSQKFGMSGRGLIEKDPSGGTGMHNRHAFLIAAGPGVRPGAEAPDATLEDIAPTALYTLGLPAPSQMDGCPLTELFREDYVAAHPPAREDEELPGATPRAETAPAEADSVVERLKGLGYM